MRVVCARCGRRLPDYVWECPDDGGDPVAERTLLSDRTRWWITNTWYAAPALMGVPVYLDTSDKPANWAAAVLSVSLTAVIVVQAWARRSTYKHGWYAGRLWLLHSLKHPVPDDLEPEPWLGLPQTPPRSNTS